MQRNRVLNKLGAGAAVTVVDGFDSRPGMGRGEGGPAAFEWGVGLLWIVLLWTWMKPIADMSGWTEPDRVVPLYVAAALYVVADMLRLRGWLGLPLKVVVTFLCVGWLFRHSGGHSGLGFDWVKVYSGLLQVDLRLIGAGEWDEISPESRTMIFLAGWALLAGVMYTILLLSKRGLWLLLVTWTYLIGLQLWPGLDTTGALLAAGGAGLALLAVLHLQRIQETYEPGLGRIRVSGEGPGASGGLGSVSAVGKISGKPEAHQTMVMEWVPEARVASSAGFGGSDGVGRGGGHPYRAQPAGTVVAPYGRLGRSMLVSSSLLVSFVVFAAALVGGGGGAGRTAYTVEPISSWSWEQVVDRLGWEPGQRRGAAEGGPPFQPGRLAAVGAVTGYGEDDSRLGGPVTVREELVFTARTPELTYWRGESKGTYTGQGWLEVKPAGLEAGAEAEAKPEVEALRLAGQPASSGGNQGGPLSEGRVITQEVLYHGKDTGALLFSGGSLVEPLTMYSTANKQLPAEALVTNPGTGKTTLGADWGQLGYTRLKVAVPAWSPEELVGAAGVVPADIAERYLQLPDQLPARVGRLAGEIVGEVRSPYAKAVLIESYLEQHYTYSLTDVPKQGKGQDFVDTFLFGGTSSGYCDYFSTTMVVLLRSVGVPARWVKGYAPGDVQSTELVQLTTSTEDPAERDWTSGTGTELERGRGDVNSSVSGAGTLYMVDVSTKHAHSWVEVYIPEAGWVMFDPTPGFSGAGANEAQAGLAALEQQLPGIRAARLLGSPQELSAAWDKASGFRAFYQSFVDSLAAGFGWLWHGLMKARLAAAAVLLLLVPAALILSRTKGQLLMLQLALRFRRRRGPGRTELELQLLNRLLERVYRRYGALQPGQTLREYAIATGTRVPEIRDALVELVLLYEQLYYSGSPSSWLPRRRLVELWTKLFDPKTEKGGSGVTML